MSETEKSYEEKLKKTIQIHFKQLKNGCSNKVCYNTHNCRNAFNFSNNSLLKLSDKELLLCSLKKAKQNDDINNLVCYNLAKYEYKSKIVDSITDWYLLLNNINQYFDPNKVAIIKKVIFEEIDEINLFNNSMKTILTDCFPELVEKNKHESVDCSVLPIEQRISLLDLLLKINFNFINFFLLTGHLNYNYNYIQYILDLFENFIKISYHFKNLNKISTEIYQDAYFLDLFKGYNEVSKYNVNINSPLANFSLSLENLQNFLTVLILDYTGDDVLPTKNELKLLAGIMRIFEIFYHANLVFNFVDKYLFENEKVNDHLSIKSQLKTYFDHHHNKKVESFHILDDEIEHFSFIKYHYIYNTASKKEIISEYNICLQEKEIKMGFQNLDILFGSGLTLNIKVNRNNLIKSTLDLIIGNLNFRKPLKVSF